MNPLKLLQKNCCPECKSQNLEIQKGFFEESELAFKCKNCGKLFSEEELKQ